MESIKSFIYEKDLRRSVKIKGFSQNLEKIMSSYDILCVASKKEGELIENGKTGLLYAYKGGYFELARRIEWVINHKEKAKLIAKAGQEDAYENFSLEKSIDKVLEVYSNLLD